MPVNRDKLLKLLENYEQNKGFFRRKVGIKKAGFGYTRGMFELKQFAENKANFDENGNIRADKLSTYQQIYVKHQKKKNSKKSDKLSNIVLNKAFGANTLKTLDPQTMTELGEGEKESMGILAGRNELVVKSEIKASGQTRAWFMKPNALPANEVIFSRLFAIFVPGSAKVRTFEHESFGQVHPKPASRYIEGRRPEQRDFSEEAVMQNGLAEYLVASVVFNSSDAKLANVKIDTHGRFSAFDFEEMLPYGTKKFKGDDFEPSRILTNDYLVHLDINSHFDMRELKQSQVFREEIFKALVKFIVFPEALLRDEISKMSAYCGLDKRNSDGYFDEISERIQLVKQAASEIDGFKEYVRENKQALAEHCFIDFYTKSCNGRFGQAIYPYKDAISANIAVFLGEEPTVIPRGRLK